MLLRIAKLYQIPNFDAEGAVLLAEWVLDEYQHSSIELIQKALTNPPRTKEKSWRLTPETITEWIETTREQMINETHRKESEERLNLPLPEANITEDTAKKLNELKFNLMQEMKSKPVTNIHEVILKRPTLEAVAVGYPHTSESQLKMRELHLEWIQENYDPLTGKPKETWVEEKSWLLSKGYFIENSQIKTI